MGFFCLLFGLKYRDSSANIAPTQSAASPAVIAILTIEEGTPPE